MIRRKQTSRKVLPPTIVRFRSCATNQDYDVNIRVGMCGFYPGDLIHVRDFSVPIELYPGMDPDDQSSLFIAHTPDALRRHTPLMKFLVLGTHNNSEEEDAHSKIPSLVMIPYLSGSKAFDDQPGGYNLCFLSVERFFYPSERSGKAKWVVPLTPLDISVIYRFGNEHIHEMEMLDYIDILRLLEAEDWSS